MKENITMSVILVKSDSGHEVASILSIRFIILCFLTTLANESHCGLLIGTLLGIFIVSSIRTRIASNLTALAKESRRSLLTKTLAFDRKCVLG